jgi:hypothetical protein
MIRTDEERRRVVAYLNSHPEQREKQRVRSRVAAARKRAADPIHQSRAQFYQELADLQGGEACAICGITPSKRRLSVDHNHATDEIRGLLCMNCNQLLGRAMESPDIMLKAMAYLAREQYTGRRFAEWQALSVASRYVRHARLEA